MKLKIEDIAGMKILQTLGMKIGYSMAKLRCNDYGFECDFVSEGDIEAVIKEFGRHSEEEHGIDYSKESLMQIILRKAR